MGGYIRLMHMSPFCPSPLPSIMWALHITRVKCIFFYYQKGVLGDVTGSCLILTTSLINGTGYQPCTLSVEAIKVQYNMSQMEIILVRHAM